MFSIVERNSPHGGRFVCACGEKQQVGRSVVGHPMRQGGIADVHHRYDRFAGTMGDVELHPRPVLCLERARQGQNTTTGSSDRECELDDGDQI